MMFKVITNALLQHLRSKCVQVRSLQRLSSQCSVNGRPKQNPKHVVYVSQSTCIYENLALEDWLYENCDLENGNYLLMWRNKPAVVIGRHQNVWMECDVRLVMRQHADLARRKSGGGAVYHDEGNLNLSFIKSRQRYCRRDNLELVVRALQSQWEVDLSINKREDILLDGLFKISGTASKLAAKRTYHHFTLLLDVDTEKLNSLLSSPMRGVRSRSTESVPAHVRNLRDSDPSLDFSSLVHCIGLHFLSADTLQTCPSIEFIESITDERFPGVCEKISELKDWEWIYAKTPPFSIHKTFSSCIGGHNIDLNINIDILKGRLDKIEFDLPEKPGNYAEYIRLFSNKMCGVRLDEEELLPLFAILQEEVTSTVPESDLTIVCWILKCAERALIS